jgi:hypothetical protein
MSYFTSFLPFEGFYPNTSPQHTRFNQRVVFFWKSYIKVLLPVVRLVHVLQVLDVSRVKAVTTLNCRRPGFEYDLHELEAVPMSSPYNYLQLHAPVMHRHTYVRHSHVCLRPKELGFLE